MSEIKPEDCKHEMFQCQVNVTRLTEDFSHKDADVIAYTSDITIHCGQCGQAFEFIGVNIGVSPIEPMANFDFTELRAPIRPSKAEPIPTDDINVN